MVLPAIFHIPSMAVSGFLYWKTWSGLRQMKQMDRKELLSKAFGILWIAWVVMVKPYVVKQAIAGSPRDGPSVFSTNWEFGQTASMQQMIDKVFVDNIRFEEDYKVEVTWVKSTAYLASVFALDVSLRTLKISFGFVNSVILIILIKPFHEPILRAIGKLSEKLKTIRSRLRATNACD